MGLYPQFQIPGMVPKISEDRGTRPAQVGFSLRPLQTFRCSLRMFRVGTGAAALFDACLRSMPCTVDGEILHQLADGKHPLIMISKIIPLPRVAN